MQVEAPTKRALVIYPRVVRRLAVVAALTVLPAGGRAQESSRSFSVSAHYALETGAPFSTIQTVAVRTLETTLAFRVRRGRTWTVELPLSAIPVALVLRTALGPVSYADGRWWLHRNERATSRGVGIKPIGIRAVKAVRAVFLHVGAGAGVLYFDRPTPAANSRRLNALSDVDVGLLVPLRGQLRGSVGYRFSHISNGNTANANPGIDSHMISLGVQR